MTSGTLYIIATPIGNLEDITYRAVRILGEVDLVAAEDTRHSLKLLNHLTISKPLTSYFDHNQQFKGERILNALRQGKSVALISDAGTPCISDPGYQLVRDAAAEGIRVVPVPGACAAITALSGSGLPSDTFTFAGFPPSRQGKRRSFLSGLSGVPGTLVLYEAPHRLEDTLADLLEVMGDRQVVVARELTKIYEEYARGTLSEVLAALPPGRTRGEIVILVAPGQAVVDTAEPLDRVLWRLLKEEGLSVKDASRKAAELTGTARNEAYSLALQLKDSDSPP
ncbi:16S rRNA (cytidine(1402)-2'-O)-methyltransferase [Geobacter sp. SVR]|uniref:16S rRNA (cytidine(1402)-2'-O)-methyltransferase n=1 Tax=Geobacter sp. SVR TaxID=2495594 RepID=UPI00143F02F6|nr:16S rRNA (cytidine(1402)-2'-O)-methyltransferase [Geobacter sp. SVR]BCS52928.1 ribosomal RNA small subunit methyltransferase I [Geobacter sp. SVR]GCF84312.1 ribosomal RNA small subunit methyltransferase I [Geobacter sp. SVR]